MQCRVIVYVCDECGCMWCFALLRTVRFVVAALLHGLLIGHCLSDGETICVFEGACLRVCVLATVTLT